MWKSKFGKTNKTPTIICNESSNHLVNSNDADRFVNFFANISNCRVNQPENILLRQRLIGKLENYSGDQNLHDSVVDSDLVHKTIFNMKDNKTAGIDNLTAEHFKNSHPVVSCAITKFFQFFIVVNYVPHMKWY